jgi:hypothetical protein
VVETLVRKLQPLVAELQEAGVGVGEWIEAVKISSFKAAHAATDAESGRAIFTRMSVRTGMTRTELQRLRRICANGTVAVRPSGRPRTLRVLDAWHRDADYLDAAGRPLALPQSGPAPSLQALIKRHAGDVPASSVLVEMERQQLLADAGDGRWHPRAGYAQRLMARINRWDEHYPRQA